MAFAKLEGGGLPAAAPYAPSTPTGTGGGVVPVNPVLEPGMPGYGGSTAGVPAGFQVGQGGYADPAGASHPYSTAVGQQLLQHLNPAPQPSGNPNGPYNTDPGYQAALAAEQMGLGQLDASLKAARERAIVDFGDPSMASMAGFGLDPQAAAFAQQNYLSGNAQLARLDKSHDLNRQAVINQLAAHGILGSGDLGYREGVVDQGYGNDAYDARQKLLDYLNGVTSQDLQSRQNLHGGVISAIQQAYQNFLNHPELYPAYPNENSAATGAANAGNAGAVAKGTPALASVRQAASQEAAHKAASLRHVMTNPYVTGQKRFG